MRPRTLTILLIVALPLCAGWALLQGSVALSPGEALDALLHLDGEEEFVLYLAPVGKHATSGKGAG